MYLMVCLNAHKKSFSLHSGICDNKPISQPRKTPVDGQGEARETDRGRNRGTQTERYTEKETERERERERKTEGEIERETDIHLQSDPHGERQSERQTDRYKERRIHRDRGGWGEREISLFFRGCGRWWHLLLIPNCPQTESQPHCCVSGVTCRPDRVRTADFLP